MPTYGLTSAGLVRKTNEIILAEIHVSLKAAFGDSIKLGSKDVFGQLAAIMAERYANLWELMETVNSSQDPDAALDAELDALCALTGTTREVAAPSTVTLVLTGDDATVVPSGSQASEEDTEAEFQTLAEATIVAASPWANATVYAVGDRVENDTPDRIYECVVAGTSAGSGGPTGTSTGIADNTVTWNYLGDGEAVIDVAAEAVLTGPTIAAARKITVIETPVSGWSNVINVLDATLGNDIEANPVLRIRREDELASGGTSPVDPVRSALLDITGVTNVGAFWNHSDVTDSDGVPPHAIEALIQGGDDQDIWDALLANVAGGIQTYGDEVGSADDGEGTTHVRKFSRPSAVTIWIDIELLYDADLYPTDGDDQIKAAIVVVGDLVLPGKDAVSSAIKSWCFGVAGVLDVTLAEIKITSPPTSEGTIAISMRELATYDTSRITVVSTPGTP